MDSNIFNRPPSIAEDTLQYTIFADELISTSESSCLALGAQIQAEVDSLLPQTFIWHRDAFELKVVPSLPYECAQKGRKEFKLEGRMRIGDSVDDEWCVVWLLRELSRSFDIAVSVYDSDGDFLLIEAAEVLPAWVSPTNAENRVWIYESHLHLIPIFYTSPSNIPRHRRELPDQDQDSDGEQRALSSEDDEFLGIVDALRLLRDASVDSIAPQSVESQVWNRIASYPSAAVQHTHLTRAFVPLDIALALSNTPSLIQRAVETFFTRDAAQLRAVHSMSRFPPNTSIMASIRMTRPAYAQLIGQKFHPPKIFGRWIEKEGSPEWRRKNIGMKIACGFEMLYAETKSKGQSGVSVGSQNIEALKDTLRRNVEYIQYLSSLKKAGFFQQEREGSNLWNSLESKAALTWVELRKTDDASRKPFATAVSEAVSAARSANADTTALDRDEENDEWMNIDEEMLDGMLQAADSQSQPPSTSKTMLSDSGLEVGQSDDGKKSDAITSAQADRLQKLAGKVQSFVEGEGDVEGAKFDDELLSDEEELSLSDDESDEGEDSSEEINEEQKAEALAKLVPPLLAGEYGAMPASYSNSQPVSAPTIATETVPILKKPEATRPIRRPILMRDKFDGVDSDDESDSETEADGVPTGGDDEDSDEDHPTVVGEVEVDMEEEEEEFLRFSREALGISEDQWNDILKDREDRGAFIPSTAGAAGTSANQPTKRTASSAARLSAASAPDESENGAGKPNPDLNSFEAVMQAMDAELRNRKANVVPKTKRSAPATRAPAIPSSTKSKGKERAPEPIIPDVHDDAGDDEDLEEAMAAELRAVLDAGSDSEDEEGPEPSLDYNLIKNFLESFKSQGGLSGPVSNLAGRLEGGRWGLPRDET